MQYLCIETSHSNGFVSLFVNQQKKTELSWNHHQHSEVIVQNLQTLIKQHSFVDLSLIAVNVGPGRFTGIRIGVNVAKTLAYHFSCPIYAFHSLRLIAQPYLKTTNLPILCAMNAFGNLFYTAIYQKQKKVVNTLLHPVALSKEELEKKMTQPLKLVGDISFHSSFQNILKKNKQLQFVFFQSISSKDFSEVVTKEKHTTSPKNWTEVMPIYLRTPGVLKSEVLKKEKEINKKEIVVSKDLSGYRLDQVVSSVVESRSQAARLIQKGCVTIENQLMKPSYKVELGDRIVIQLPEEKIQNYLKPYDFYVPIIYEDECILVVDKPAGLVSHPGPGHAQDTLVNALIHKLHLHSATDAIRLGLLHRLDKEVSGLVVLSKTAQAHIFLAQQFSRRKISRTYWAFCYNPIRFDQGRIETYIQRHPVDRKKFISSETDGKKSITLFKVLKRGDISLVECRLLTGRTHQIRIHANEISGGIVGDKVYTSSKHIKKLTHTQLIQNIQQLNRVALHAIQLRFIHPESKKEMTFHSKLPDSLQRVMDDI